MAKKREVFDILSAEGQITDILAKMNIKMIALKQEKAKGTHLFDALRKEQKGVIKMDTVDVVKNRIQYAINEAKSYWSESTQKLNDLDARIKRELNSADLTSVAFTRLKKLQSKVIEAKQKLSRFNVESMEASAKQFLEQITRASKNYFYYM